MVTNVKQPDRDEEERPQARHPNDFESEELFVQHVNKQLERGLSDTHNREQRIEDARFFAGEQWDDSVVQDRRDKRKPVLTINRLPAFVQTFIANRRLNETTIKVAPDAGGTKEIAKVRQGLIRAIQKVSRADRAYNKAFENAVIAGEGAFQVTLEYARDDVFEQDISIRGIPNALSVVWDPGSTDPTGADAQWVAVVDSVDSDTFNDMYPDASAGAAGGRTNLIGKGTRETVTDSDTVDVTSFWRMRSERRTLAMMVSGEVEDVTDQNPDLWVPRVLVRDNGDPVIRESLRRFAEMHLVTATDVLEGPYKLPIKRVPVFRVGGWDVNIGDARRSFGLVRFLRDPLKMHNYWRSVVAEKLMGQPNNKWLAPDTAVEGREQKFREAHLSDDPLLIYNSESGTQPQLISPAPISDALLGEASLTAQDIRDVSSIHEASLGQESNEVSGEGILARQRVGEAGMVIYNDNTNMAIEEAGMVINDLIPIVYDTPRVIKVLGENDTDLELLKINFPDDKSSIDITHGKYQTTVSTGPSYATKRIEAQKGMLNMINAMPETVGIAADKIIEAQDWPGADEIAKRLRTQLPPGLIDEDEMSPQQLQAQQQNAQIAQQTQQLELEKLQAEAAERRGRAVESAARAFQAIGLGEKSFAEADQIPERENRERLTAELNAIIQGIHAIGNLDFGGSDDNRNS